MFRSSKAYGLRRKSPEGFVIRRHSFCKHRLSAFPSPLRLRATLVQYLLRADLLAAILESLGSASPQSTGLGRANDGQNIK